MALECTHLLSPKHNRRGRPFSGRACRAARGPYGELSKASLLQQRDILLKNNCRFRSGQKLSYIPKQSPRILLYLLDIPLHREA